MPVSQPHIFNVTAHILLKTKSCWVASTCLHAHIFNFTAPPLLKTKSCWVAAPPQCLHSHVLCTHIHSSSTFENQILLGELRTPDAPLAFTCLRTPKFNVTAHPFLKTRSCWGGCAPPDPPLAFTCLRTQILDVTAHLVLKIKENYSLYRTSSRALACMYRCLRTLSHLMTT